MTPFELLERAESKIDNLALQLNNLSPGSAEKIELNTTPSGAGYDDYLLTYLIHICARVAAGDKISLSLDFYPEFHARRYSSDPIEIAEDMRDQFHNLKQALQNGWDKIERADGSTCFEIGYKPGMNFLIDSYLHIFDDKLMLERLRGECEDSEVAKSFDEWHSRFSHDEVMLEWLRKKRNGTAIGLCVSEWYNLVHRYPDLAMPSVARDDYSAIIKKPSAHDYETVQSYSMHCSFKQLIGGPYYPFPVPLMVVEAKEKIAAWEAGDRSFQLEDTPKNREFLAGLGVDIETLMTFKDADCKQEWAAAERKRNEYLQQIAPELNNGVAVLRRDGSRLLMFQNIMDAREAAELLTEYSPGGPLIDATYPEVFESYRRHKPSSSFSWVDKFTFGTTNLAGRPRTYGFKINPLIWRHIDDKRVLQISDALPTEETKVPWVDEALRRIRELTQPQAQKSA